MLDFENTLTVSEGETRQELTGSKSEADSSRECIACQSSFSRPGGDDHADLCDDCQWWLMS